MGVLMPGRSVSSTARGARCNHAPRGLAALTDLGRRNGTLVNGIPALGERKLDAGDMVRVGGALLLAVSDILPFEQFPLGLHDGIVRAEIR
jgi:hypothetical protein